MLKLKSTCEKSKDAAVLDSQVTPPWHKKSLQDKGQRLITVAGVESKVGATHLALSLGCKARDRDINCAVILSSDSFEALKRYYVLTVREEPRSAGKESRQFASLSGLSIMSGVLPGDLDGYQLLIWDCGSLPQGQRRFASGDLRCLISGGQPWELLPLNEVLMNLDYEELSTYAICVRGAAEHDIDHLRQQMAGKVPFITIMHKPEWGEVKLREDLLAILRLAKY